MPEYPPNVLFILFFFPDSSHDAQILRPLQRSIHTAQPFSIPFPKPLPRTSASGSFHPEWRRERAAPPVGSTWFVPNEVIAEGDRRKGPKEYRRGIPDELQVALSGLRQDFKVLRGENVHQAEGLLRFDVWNMDMASAGICGRFGKGRRLDSAAVAAAMFSEPPSRPRCTPQVRHPLPCFGLGEKVESHPGSIHPVGQQRITTSLGPPMKSISTRSMRRAAWPLEPTAFPGPTILSTSPDRF